MQIKAIFTRWIENLASLAEGWRVSFLAHKSIYVARNEGYLVIRRSQSPDSPTIGKVAVGSKIQASIAEATRKHSVTFEIAADKVVTRHLVLPARAREFLQGIVRNQIDRLSPWPSAQAVYGIDAKPDLSDPETLNVSVFIAPQSSIDLICSELAESNIAPAQIVYRTEADGALTVSTLWARPSKGLEPQRIDLPRLIVAGLAAMVFLSASVTVWAAYSSTQMATELEDVVARKEALQRQSQSPRKLQDIALLKPPQRAWAMKENSPAAILVLEALSRALPDNAYLNELQLENTTLRIAGLTADAPSLIGALEQSGHFSSVHFFAPTTKGQNNSLYKFYIEARVEDHPSFIGN